MDRDTVNDSRGNRDTDTYYHLYRYCHCNEYKYCYANLYSYEYVYLHPHEYLNSDRYTFANIYCDSNSHAAFSASRWAKLF